jgi:hypothetical protein
MIGSAPANSAWKTTVISARNSTNPSAGCKIEIYPQNAQPIEFGEPLFAIKSA